MMNRFNITLFKRDYEFVFRTSRTKTSLQWGVGNRCEGGEYVLFLDYDDIPLTWIHDEITLLQEQYATSLGDAFIFRTKHGHHVIFLERCNLGDLAEYLDVTTCDKHYRKIPMFYARKIWVLRQSEKKNEHGIEYLGVQRGYAPHVMRSSAHAEYIVTIMGVPKEQVFTKGRRFDGHEKLIVGAYHVAE